MHIDKDALTETLSEARRQLLASRAPGGYWTGYLSSSALSTATAVFALASADPRAYESLVRGGLDWLADNANTDGGWGDTVVSESNISTTALCWSAFSVAESASEKYRRAVAAAEGWLTRAAGGLEPKQIAESIIAAYGKDRT
ncbi:MAG: squalene--hopene cyclase, partial [Phycisphaerae bacterium]|nr:squalene--hopene cyclase [Phycisphaerae bacterium]